MGFVTWLFRPLTMMIMGSRLVVLGISTFDLVFSSNHCTSVGFDVIGAAIVAV